MKYKRISIFSILILAVVATVTVVLHAQNANKGLIVYPSNFDLTSSTTPHTEKVTLQNNTDQPVTIKVTPKNFTAAGEEGGVELTENANTFSMANWITVTPQNVIIPQKTSKEFTFTITPPKNAEPGGHFGSLVFSTVPNPQIKGTAGASISQEVASLILFKIPGNVDEKASMESFTPDRNFYEFGPVTFTARVKNSGGVHVAPVGQIIIKGTFGDKYIVSLTPRNVLPNAVRKISSVLPNKLLIGQYSVALLATYGTKNGQLSGYTEFTAFPVRYALIAGAVLLVLFVLRKRIYKALRALIIGK